LSPGHIGDSGSILPHKYSSMSARCKVLLVDDNATFLRQVQRFLDTAETIEVVASTSRATEAVEICREVIPDVCVVDVSMPELTGLQLVPMLRDVRSEMRIVILTSHSDASYREAAMAMGADRFVVKTSLVDELVPAILGLPADAPRVEPRDGD
jgi:two-component system, NarL family, response regulator DesR